MMQAAPGRTATRRRLRWVVSRGVGGAAARNNDTGASRPTVKDRQLIGRLV